MIRLRRRIPARIDPERRQALERLEKRRVLDAAIEKIDIDKDVRAWEDLILDNDAEDWAVPFWRSLQAMKELALQNASLRRMMKN